MISKMVLRVTGRALLTACLGSFLNLGPSVQQSFPRPMVGRVRDRAVFDLAIHSKPRGCGILEKRT